jgi:DHA1 family inner membrane transport protein
VTSSATTTAATPEAAPPLSGRRVVLAIVALALGGFALGTTEFVTLGLLPEIATGVGIGIPTAGHLISAYAIGVVVGAPVISALGARLPRRGLLVGMTAVVLAGNTLTALAPGHLPLVVARFLAGLPHGAYFGVASLVAASLVGPELRGRAVSSVMLGLSVANVAGVPAATFLGQQLGWRSAYWAVVVLAVLTAAAVLTVVPSSPGRSEATIRQELGALRRPQVLLTLLVATIGFGGMFAMYSYISPLVTEVAGLSVRAVPAVLLVFGVGGVLGAVLGGWLADRALFRSLVGAMVLVTALLGAVFLVAAQPAALLLAVFAVSISTSVLVVCLQLRLMEVAGDAQMFGAAMNHSALNAANALGAWLGGLVIAGGLGYAAPSLVGAGLGVAGLAVLAVSGLLRRREVLAG